MLKGICKTLICSWRAVIGKLLSKQNVRTAIKIFQTNQKLNFWKITDLRAKRRSKTVVNSNNAKERSKGIKKKNKFFSRLIATSKSRLKRRWPG